MFRLWKPSLWQGCFGIPDKWSRLPAPRLLNFDSKGCIRPFHLVDFTDKCSFRLWYDLAKNAEWRWPGRNFFSTPNIFIRRGGGAGDRAANVFSTFLLRLQPQTCSSFSLSIPRVLTLGQPTVACAIPRHTAPSIQFSSASTAFSLGNEEYKYCANAKIRLTTGRHDR